MTDLAQTFTASKISFDDALSFCGRMMATAKKGSDSPQVIANTIKDPSIYLRQPNLPSTGAASQGLTTSGKKNPLTKGSTAAALAAQMTSQQGGSASAAVAAAAAATQQAAMLDYYNQVTNYYQQQQQQQAAAAAAASTFSASDWAQLSAYLSATYSEKEVQSIMAAAAIDPVGTMAAIANGDWAKLVSAGAASQQQVWPLTQFVSVSFSGKLIDLP